MQLLQKLRSQVRLIKEIAARVDDLQRAVGRMEARQLGMGNGTIRDFEFKVYSQTGEDGIIQYLIGRLEIPNPIFVEFGVQDYKEANTRFLLQNNYWSGLVIDGSVDNIRAIKADPIYWRYNLKAEHAFVDRDNINQILRSNGIAGDIGLLSVDIDGNDYWVWEAITEVSPRIVICEYNSTFGCCRQVTIPYDKQFVRTHAHFSNLYYGASISALYRLGRAKGYSLVGSNRFGNNLFFVRDDIIGSLPVTSPQDAYVQAPFRESRDATSTPTYLDFNERQRQIADMPLVDLESHTTVKVRDIIESRKEMGTE